MAGQIAWKISFPGLSDEQKRLTDLESTLTRIGQKSGLISRGGTVNGVGGMAGAGGNTIIAPVGGGTSGAVAGAEGGAIGAAFGAGAGRGNGFILEELSRRRQEREMLKNFQFWHQRNIQTELEGVLAISPGIAKASIIPSPSVGRGRGIPPLIDKTDAFTPVKLAMTRWARSLGENFGMGNQFAAWASTLTPLRAALAAVTIAILALHVAIKLAVEGIKHGSESYRQGARHGESVSRAFTLKYAFESIGMGGGEDEALRNLGQFNPRARQTVLSGGAVVGAMKAGQYAGLQQLQNMSHEFAEVITHLRVFAEVMELSSKTTEVMATQNSVLGAEWHTLLAQLADAMYPVINLFQLLADAAIRSVAAQLAAIHWAENILGLTTSAGDPAFKRYPMTMAHGGTSQAGAWERMGFTFPGASNNFMKDIASNTAETVRAIKDLTHTLRSSNTDKSWNSLMNVAPIPSMG